MARGKSHAHGIEQGTKEPRAMHSAREVSYKEVCSSQDCDHSKFS